MSGLNKKRYFSPKQESENTDVLSAKFIEISQGFYGRFNVSIEQF